MAYTVFYIKKKISDKKWAIFFIITTNSTETWVASSKGTLTTVIQEKIPILCVSKPLRLH